jgi:hypothetical protein
MTEKNTEMDQKSARTALRTHLTLFCVIFANVRANVRTELSRLKRLDEAAHRRLNDKLRPVAYGLLATVGGVTWLTQPALAEYCTEGIGLLVMDAQLMLWQIVLGLLVLIALIGLVLRAFPIFTGSTAIGNVMLIGVIVGVIGFVFIVTFIDMALGYTGGPGVGEGCSPFL